SLGTVTATPTLGNAVIDPGDNVNLSISLSNGGGASATNVQGVLTTTSGDVTINTGTESYPTINAGGSATSGVPFNFTFSSSANCGSPLPFVLTVTYAESPTPRDFHFVVSTGVPATTIPLRHTGTPTFLLEHA